MARHVVARVDEIREGGRKIVELEGRSIGVFNVDGRFYAIRNRCPHQGGPLCLGALGAFLHSTGPGHYAYDPGRPTVRCPWHLWEFDIATGGAVFDDGVRVKCYDARVERGADRDGPALEKRAEVPPAAETYPVTAEGGVVTVET